MAALGRLCGSSSIQLRRSIAPPALLIPCRGIVSKLFVGGLSFYTTENGLAEVFSHYGQVVEAKIIMDRVSDRSKGFGFVSFASEDEAYNAVTEMNGKTLNGRVIFVDYAKPRAGYSGGMPIARGPPEPITSTVSKYQQMIEQGYEDSQEKTVKYMEVIAFIDEYLEEKETRSSSPQKMVLFSLDTQDHHAALIAKGTYLIQSQESNHLFPCRKRIHQYYPIMASTLRLIIIAPLARLTLSSFREFIAAHAKKAH